MFRSCFEIGKFIQNFSWKPEGKNSFKRLDVNGAIILNYTTKKHGVRFDLNSTDSWYETATDSCEHKNKLSRSTRGREFRDKLSSFQPVTKNSATCSYYNYL